MVSRRNLHTTLKMLQAAGICAGATVAHGKVRVWLSQPNPDLAPWVYDGTDREYAAHWLAAAVVYFYPKSDLARVWNVSGKATAPSGQAKSKWLNAAWRACRPPPGCGPRHGRRAGSRS